ncbi:hypothetical protein [Actinophytocola sp.]|uniref:hypothetical protein n=1 Tax=Actinophytocola sp. TaxID=1872138 RepID=UPI002D7F7B8B|nr:hypothetical protein [Actinophytocola sp.]HET9138618.1 hypothetical protein [Actinophytocola sp.]
MGKKHKKGTPADVVRKLMKKGKLKKKCCRSDPRCKKCPVLALKRIKADYKKSA